MIKTDLLHKNMTPKKIPRNNKTLIFKIIII